jgi:hypothetical protein
MSNSEVKSLPVARFADDECHIYLWATNVSLPRAFDVLEAWGFKYATTLTWCKTTKSLEKARYGMGYYFRSATEHLLFGVKGSMRLTRFDCPTWFQAPPGDGGHSSKPLEAYQLIESCLPARISNSSPRGAARLAVWVLTQNRKTSRRPFQTHSSRHSPLRERPIRTHTSPLGFEQCAHCGRP